MEGWLPYLGVVLVLLLGLSIIFTFTWLTRPSGRAGRDRRPAWQRLLPLIALVAPLLLLAGFAIVLFPVAPPQLVILRSQAVGFGVSLDRDPCLDKVVAALGRREDSPPPCLAEHMPEPAGISPADPRVAAARVTFRNKYPVLDQTDVLLQREAFDTAIGSAVAAAVPGVPAGSEAAKALKAALALEARWWPLARRARVVDAGPIVKRALDLFVLTPFSDDAYANVDSESHADLVKTLQRAVELALNQKAPDPLEPGTLPPAPEPRPRSRPEVVEAVEIAVLRLLVARSNVQGVIVEYHRRAEDDVAGEAWRALGRTLALGGGTARAAPVGLARFPGSAIAPSRLLQSVGAPWRQDEPGGDLKINVTLAFGGTPVPEWKIKLRNGADPAALGIDFTCESGLSSDSEAAITSCLRYASQLKAGDTVFTTLTIPATKVPAPGSPLFLEVSFEPGRGLEPLRREVLPGGLPASISVDVNDPAGSGSALSRTLSCLISLNTVASHASIVHFRRLLTEADKAEITQGAGGARLRPDPYRGIWVYPADLEWKRIEKELIPARIDTRPHKIDSLLLDRAELLGAALFPFALPGQGLPDGLGARARVPLAPERPTALAPSSDPAEGLVAPPSFSFPFPYAEPVVFTHLPRMRASSSVAVIPVAAAPIAWRIALPDAPDGKRGGIVWFFGFDPVHQGLLLDTNCLPPDAKDESFLCDPSKQTQIYEPVYEETRFFPVWLWILRAARESAVAWAVDVAVAPTALSPPVFLSDDMLARARVASASTGLAMLLVGLSFYAVFVIALRLRQNR